MIEKFLTDTITRPLVEKRILDANFIPIKNWEKKKTYFQTLTG
jgi:hypothetical protein